MLPNDVITIHTEKKTDLCSSSAVFFFFFLAFLLYNSCLYWASPGVPSAAVWSPSFVCPCPRLQCNIKNVRKLSVGDRTRISPHWCVWNYVCLCQAQNRVGQKRAFITLLRWTLLCCWAPVGRKEKKDNSQTIVELDSSSLLLRYDT